MGGPWTRDELRQGRLYWLLDLTWAGRTFRLAERHVEATIGSDTLDYFPGLSVGDTLVDEVDLFADDPAPRSVPITAHLPVDVPDLVQRGHDLGGATGKLRLWCKGSTASAVFVDGVVRDPEYETKDDPIVFSLDELPVEDVELWPPALARIDATSWPNAAEEHDGEYYPWILGIPGLDENTSGLFGSPGLHVDDSGGNDHLLIAGHPVAATQVAVRNYDDDTNDDFAVAHKEDGQGRTIAYVDLNEVGTSITVDPADPYWVRWESSTGGGVKLPDGTTMRGAGDQLIWWLRRSSVRWDRGRLEAIRQRANGFLIDSAAIASPERRITPWSWITEHLLPILPVSARQGPGGLYFAWFDTSPPPTATLDVDEGFCLRSGPVVYTDRDDVANEFRLSYRVDAERDKPLKRFILTGSSVTLDEESDAVEHGLCVTSNARYGRRVREMRSDVVYDAATAARVCLWMAEAFALQQRRIVYDCPQDFGYLEPGDAVLVGDDGLNLDDAPAIVEAIGWSTVGRIEIRVRLIESPARADRGS